MISDGTLRTDCRHFRTDRPCTPHKLRGKQCATCDEYDAAAFRVTIVKLAAVGDVLRTTSFLPGLRAKYPNAWLTWLTARGALPLFDGNPLVDEVVATDGSTLPATLAQTPQDVVLCPDADRTTVALAASVKLREGGARVGFDLDADGFVTPQGGAARRWFEMGLCDAAKRANAETYQSLVGAILGLELPIADRPCLVISAAEAERARAWLAATGIGDRKVVGINTGAGGRWPQKQWTLSGQSGLIAELHRRGLGVVLLGGPEEVARHADLVAACPGVVDGGTDNTLRDFFARLDQCDVLVTGDTMALHAGLALGKPVVALFGPTSAAEIELYGSGAKVFTDALDCLGCYGSCDKSPDCQDSISVEMVLAALEPFIA